MHRQECGTSDKNRKQLKIGSFWKAAPQNAEENDPLISYYPDVLESDICSVFRESELLNTLSNAIDAMPQMERLLTSLYYNDGLTLDEIGAVLGIDEADLLQLHTKATQRLRSTLSEK
jgi:RNA polymerase sigma factor (sigma-70 family)